MSQNSICEPKFWGGSLFQNFWPKSKVTCWGIPKNIKKSGVFGQKPAFLEPSKIWPNFFQKMTSFCFCSHSVNFCPISFRKDSLEAERQIPSGPLKQKNLRSTENWGQTSEHKTFRAPYLFSGPLIFFLSEDKKYPDDILDMDIGQKIWEMLLRVTQKCNLMIFFPGFHQKKLENWYISKKLKSKSCLWLIFMFA